jgi:prophage antirepressor-like protein
MNHTAVFNILGAAWNELDMYQIEGIPHWPGYQVVRLLGLTNTTQAIRGNKHFPKIKFPLYQKQFVPEINIHRSIYMLTLEGIIQVIMKNRKRSCKILKYRLIRNDIV